MAWFRSRRSPYQGGMIVSGVMSASWVVPMHAAGLGQRRAGRQGGAVRAVEREAAAGRGGDEVAAVVHHLVVPGAQADQVAQVGAAAVDPVPDVVQVGPAGLAPREPAPAAVPLAGGAADRELGLPAAPAQGQHRACVAVGHPGQRRGAGEHLRGGHADRRAVLDMSPWSGPPGHRGPAPGRRAFPRKRRDPRPGPAARRARRRWRAPPPGTPPRHRPRPPSRPGTTRPPRPGRRPGPTKVRTAGAEALAAARLQRARPRRAFPRQPAFSRGSGRFRGNARARTPAKVGAGGAQRPQQHRPGQRRQPERAGQRPVLLQPPGQPAPHPGVRVVRPG